MPWIDDGSVRIIGPISGSRNRYRLKTRDIFGNYCFVREGDTGEIAVFRDSEDTGELVRAVKCLNGLVDSR
jgi:hypothetical protein